MLNPNHHVIPLFKQANRFMLAFGLMAGLQSSPVFAQDSSEHPQIKTQVSSPSTALIKHTAEVRGIKISYSKQGQGSPVLLIHGWPQSQDEWRKIAPLLAKTHTVITVDLPGIADSEPSKVGYSKKELARYLHDLVQQLGYSQIAVVGHDIGGQVAYAYAGQFAKDVSSLTIIDVPIPGLAGWEQERGKWPRWHFAFHQQKDLPEILVRNNVKEYLNYFFKGLSYNKEALNDIEVQPFFDAYSKESTLHAGFELYRAFDQDSQDNRKMPILKMPVLAIGGEHSRIKDYVYQQLQSVTQNLHHDVAPNSSHFIPEENPEWLANRIHKFVNKNQ